MKTFVRTALAALAVSASLSALACSGAEDPAERVGSATSPVIGGSPSTADQDAVVFVAILENGQFAGTCTGTLLAPNLVLTALHCVADTDEGALCGADGKPIQGGAVRGTRSASDFAIITGNAIDSEIAPSRVAKVTKVVTTGSETMCNSDIALLVLDRKVPNAKVAPIRLDKLVEKKETITSVGWGLTDDGQSPSHRMTRAGIPVLAVGPIDGVGPSEFLVGESVCSGDSGGPAIAKSGAVVGIVSRGGNGKARDPQNPASTCIGAEVVYTSLAPFKSTIMSAFNEAGATPTLEKGSAPAAKEPAPAADPAAEEAPAETAAAAAPAKPASNGSSSHGCAASPSSASFGDIAFAFVLVLVAALAKRRATL